MTAAYEHFRARVDSGEYTAIDPYAAESPAEFFAVASEVFFAEPALLLHEYARVYDLLRRFYGQDPARRAGLLMEWEAGAPPADGPRASALTKR
jgi:Mlc titration factor MtfA (ptsG expression regulator)